MPRPLCAPLAALLCFACSTPHLGILPRYGTFDPDGTILVEGNAGGAGVSATNTLDSMGLEEDDGILGIRADLRWGAPHLTAAWQQSEHGGDGTLTAEISDDDVSIPAGSNVSSDFDLGLGELIVTFDLIPGDTFELGLGLGATVLDLDLAVTSTSGPSSGQTIDPDRLTLPVPLLAARAGVQFWRLDVQALLGGVDISYDDDSAAFYDLDVFARLSLFGRADKGHGALLVGWRRIDLDVDYEGDSSNERVEADVTFDGPYIGLSLGI